MDGKVMGLNLQLLLRNGRHPLLLRHAARHGWQEGGRASFLSLSSPPVKGHVWDVRGLRFFLFGFVWLTGCCTLSLTFDKFNQSFVWGGEI